MAKNYFSKALAVGLSLTLCAGIVAPAFAAEGDVVDIISTGIAGRLEQEAIGDTNDAAKALNTAVKTAGEVNQRDEKEIGTTVEEATEAAAAADKAAAAADKAAADAANTAPPTPEDAEEAAKTAKEALEEAKQAVADRDRAALAEAQDKVTQAKDKAEAATKKYEAAEQAVKDAKDALETAKGKDLTALEQELAEAEKALAAAEEAKEAAQKQQDYAQVYAAVAAVLATTKEVGEVTKEDLDTAAALLEVLKDKGGDPNYGTTAGALLGAGQGVFNGTDPEGKEFNKYLNGDPDNNKEAAQLMAMMLGLVNNYRGILEGNEKTVLEYMQYAYDAGADPDSKYREQAVQMLGDIIGHGEEARTQMIEIYAAIVDDVTGVMDTEVGQDAITKQQAAIDANEALGRAVEDYNTAEDNVKDAQKKLAALQQKVAEGKDRFNRALQNAENELKNAQENLGYAKENKERAEKARDEAVASYEEAMKLVIRDIASSSGGSASAAPIVEIDDTDVPLASGPVTRAQFIDYLWRRAGEPEAEPAGFVDVAEDHEFAPAINWAKSIGIIEGNGDNTFDPDALVTTAAVRIILTRYAAYLDIEMPKLTTLKGGDGEAVLNCDQVLAEFFGEEYQAPEQDKAA